MARLRLNKIMRESIIERDGGLCVICKSQAVDLHHVMLKSHSGNNSSYNLVCVCRKCHSAIHRNNKKWFPILFKLLKEYYPNITKEMMKR